jgi:hypothetical protein
MRIEVLEKRLSDTDPDTGQHHLWTKGDTATVSDAYGKYLCERGWAKDMAGKVKTAERKPGLATLEVQKATIGSRGRTRG